jgi:hypothetical protein
LKLGLEAKRRRGDESSMETKPKTQWKASRGSRRSDVLDYIQMGEGFAALTRGIGQTNAEVTASARLIENAPELLAALHDLLGQVEQGAECQAITINSPTMKEALANAKRVLIAASSGRIDIS